MLAFFFMTLPTLLRNSSKWEVKHLRIFIFTHIYLFIIAVGNYCISVHRDECQYFGLLSLSQLIIRISVQRTEFVQHAQIFFFFSFAQNIFSTKYSHRTQQSLWQILYNFPIKILKNYVVEILSAPNLKSRSWVLLKFNIIRLANKWTSGKKRRFNF